MAGFLQGSFSYVVKESLGRHRTNITLVKMTERFSYQLKVLAKKDKEEFQDEFEPSQE